MEITCTYASECAKNRKMQARLSHPSTCKIVFIQFNKISGSANDLQ